MAGYDAPDDGSSDIFSLYTGDDVAAKARADAMARRARGLQGAGLILKTLTGDRDPAGGALAQSGQHLEDQLAGAAQHRAQQQIQEKRLGIQEKQMENTLRHQQTLEALGFGRLGVQQDLGQQRIDAMTKALALRGVRYNPNTGDFENVAKKAGGPLVPPRRAAGPLVPPGAVAPVTAAAAAPGAAPDSASPAPQPAATPQPGAPTLTRFPAMGGKMLDKALKDLGADFDPSGGRAGEFGKNQARFNAATRLLQLAQTPDGKAADLNPQQMPELAQSLASLISNGGQGTMAQIEHLTPKTMSGDYAKVAQWLTNEPHGAGQQAFVQNMIETAKREQSVAQQGIEQVRGQRAQKHQRVLRGNPEEARRVLQGFGWDLGADGAPAMKGAAAPPSATVKVKYQDKVLEIPRARLAEAVKDGAEEVK